jgi:mono/diheme cytochrome c family protein
MWLLKQKRHGALAILAKPAFGLLLAALSSAQVLMAGTDLHWLWDDRCAACHGHSGEFTRRFLRADDGELIGPHHSDNLRIFMRHHYLPASEVDAVYAMLLAQALTPPRFQAECSNCHGSAAQLVRAGTTLHAGDPLRLRSGQTVRQFLQGHRGLQADDIDFYVALLTRVAAETGRP